MLIIVLVVIAHQGHSVVIGDVFDEGSIATAEEFQEYKVTRLHGVTNHIS